MNRRCWFFDLDGTLADTDGDIRLAWKATIAELGLDRQRFEERFVTGPSIDDVIRTIYPESFSEELVATVRKRFGEHYDTDGFPTTNEYPGILDAARELKRRGATVAIATNKRFAGATALARKFGWMEVFAALYAGDMHKDDAIGKLRKPELLKLAMDELGVRPEECVMVGDTISDFEAARANGMKSIAVAWGYGKPEELAQADCIIRNAKELLKNPT